MEIKKKLIQFNSLISNVDRLMRDEDIYSLHLIDNILHAGGYLPLTGMSLRPYALAFMLNEIVINKRESIIEFGTGISTVLIARLIKLNKLSTKLVTVDENESWQQMIKEILIKENIQDCVQFIQTSLVKNKSVDSIDTNHWYNEAEVGRQLSDEMNFDMVIVDGPTAHDESIALSRYFAMPFLKNKLKNSNVIFLDDCVRKGETRILKLWAEEFGREFKIYDSTIGVSYNGEAFISNPSK